jgi:nucleoside-diphosphate-sugar epimerase
VNIVYMRARAFIVADNIHAVVGLGPVGRVVIDELVARGLPARAVGRRPATDLPPGVEVATADVTDAAAAELALAGVAVVYHTASAPYDRWPELLPAIMSGVLDAAAATGAKVVYADNLYAYGPADEPLTEDLPYRASGPNGRVRAALAEKLMDAHRSGTVRATIGRASDYYGPRGLQSTAGERLFRPALHGKRAQLLGDPDLPHTLTYLPDFGRGLVELGLHQEALGEVWHVPSAEALSMREFAELVFEAAGQPVRLQVLPPLLLRLLAIVSPTMRAVREQQYQREAAWIVDHSKFAAAFGAEVTPHAAAVRETLAWFAKLETSGRLRPA